MSPSASCSTQHAHDEEEFVRELIGEYAASLDEDRRYLFGTYRFVDMARKVMGVGSVGTRAWVFLFVGREKHDFYVRQLWDWKASIDLSTMSEPGLHAYTRACGWSMARTHARSGDRLAIAAYLRGGSSFDRAIARFSAAYADQNELDYQRLADRRRCGRRSACRARRLTSSRYDHRANPDARRF